MKSNVAVVWCRRPGPAAPATFTHHFPGTIVLEGGTGNRLTPGVGRDLANGVLHMLTVLGVLPEDILPFHWAGMQRPMRVTDEQVIRVRASRGGLFLPEGELWSEIDIGAPLGEVIDPLSGETIEKIVNPASGHVMALREHPVVYPGSMVARVVSS
jgi:hypothetical protein